MPPLYPQITSLTDDVSFYNILRHHDSGDEAAVAALAASVGTRAARQMFADPRGRALAQRHLAGLHAQSLSQLMNGAVRDKLKVCAASLPPPHCRAHTGTHARARSSPPT